MHQQATFARDYRGFRAGPFTALGPPLPAGFWSCKGRDRSPWRKFEMTWEGDGRATFSTGGPSVCPGEAHVHLARKRIAACPILSAATLIGMIPVSARTVSSVCRHPSVGATADRQAPERTSPARVRSRKRRTASGQLKGSVDRPALSASVSAASKPLVVSTDAEVLDDRLASSHPAPPLPPTRLAARSTPPPSCLPAPETITHSRPGFITFTRLRLRQVGPLEPGRRAQQWPSFAAKPRVSGR